MEFRRVLFRSFVERKRQELFIESIAALIARQPVRPIYGLMFVAALDNRTQSALEKKVQMLKLGEHVRFMGWRTPGVRWIAACDMLMVPAIDEPFGRTLIEAMLVGTPIVATRSDRKSTRLNSSH